MTNRLVLARPGVITIWIPVSVEWLGRRVVSDVICVRQLGINTGPRTVPSVVSSWPFLITIHPLCCPRMIGALRARQLIP